MDIDTEQNDKADRVLSHAVEYIFLHFREIQKIIFLKHLWIVILSKRILWIMKLLEAALINDNFAWLLLEWQIANCLF